MSATSDRNDVVEEKPLKKYWRPIAAYVYLVICLFDFMIMPLVYEINRPSARELTELAQEFNTDQHRALEILKEDRTWTPITVSHGAMFHVAFLGIVGAAAATRGWAQREAVKNGKFPT